MRNRPLTHEEIEYRDRIVPLAYLAFCWDENWQELYKDTSLSLRTVPALLKHFPKCHGVTQDKFTSHLLQFVYSKNKANWKKVYDDLWCRARFEYESDLAAEERKRTDKTKTNQELVNPAIYTGLTPRNH
jgi:hypothetical protein